MVKDPTLAFSIGVWSALILGWAGYEQCLSPFSFVLCVRGTNCSEYPLPIWVFLGFNSWCRLGIGWCAIVSCPLWAFHSAADRIATDHRPWPTRSSTGWQSNGTFLGRRCTRWKVWRGNLPDKNRDWPTLDHRPVLRPPCAVIKWTRVVIDYTFFNSVKILPWRNCNRSTDHSSPEDSQEWWTTGCELQLHWKELRTLRICISIELVEFYQEIIMWMYLEM